MKSHSFCLPACFFAVILCAVAQEKAVTRPPMPPKPQWTLVISAARNPVTAGSAVELNILMSNSTEEDVLIWIDNAGDQCDLIVRDAAGKSAPETRLGAKAHAHPFPDDVHPYVSSGGGVSVKPGERREWVQDASKWYGFNRPGTYTLQAKKSDIKLGRLVESNVITIMVIK